MAMPTGLQLVDASGRLFNGDELLYLMADDRLGRDEHVPGVVGTLTTNMAVEVALKARGVQFVRAKVGDRYVLKSLEKHRWISVARALVTCSRWTNTPPATGWYPPCRCCKLCARSGKTMAELLAGVTLFPQTLINVRLTPGQDWKSNTRMAEETQGR